jgi:micrococcal nuclease
MLRIVNFIFFFLISFCVFGGQSIQGKVVAISDGDTFTILTINKEQIKIRLYGVDCPESRQDFGTRAKQFTSTLCFGKMVKAEVKNHDRYGRKIAIVILPDGKILNKELLLSGMAWHYKHYDKSVDLAQLESIARLRKSGIWSTKNPVAPWEFRQNKRGFKKVSGKKATFTPCTGLTKAGKHCRNKAKYNGKCYQHRLG